MQASRDFSSNKGKIMHYIAIRLDGNLRTIENITKETAPRLSTYFSCSQITVVSYVTRQQRKEDSKMSLCD